MVQKIKQSLTQTRGFHPISVVNCVTKKTIPRHFETYNASNHGA